MRVLVTGYQVQTVKVTTGEAICVLTKAVDSLNTNTVDPVIVRSVESVVETELGNSVLTITSVRIVLFVEEGNKLLVEVT